MEGIIRMFAGVLGKDAHEGDTTDYSAEELETRRSRRERREVRQQPRDLTVQKVAEVIDELPSDVSCESASFIVRHALAAVGIEISSIEKVTQARESKLSSEIELIRKRQKQFREQTEEAVRSFEEEIRKVQKACDTVLAEDEKNLTRASAALEEVRRIRVFFDFSETNREENTTLAAQDSIQPPRVYRT